jgi:hypothetical protein
LLSYFLCKVKERWLEKTLSLRVHGALEDQHVRVYGDPDVRVYGALEDQHVRVYGDQHARVYGDQHVRVYGALGDQHVRVYGALGDQHVRVYGGELHLVSQDREKKNLQILGLYHGT